MSQESAIVAFEDGSQQEETPGFDESQAHTSELALGAEELRAADAAEAASIAGRTLSLLSCPHGVRGQVETSFDTLKVYKFYI